MGLGWHDPGSKGVRMSEREIRRIIKEDSGPDATGSTPLYMASLPGRGPRTS